MRKMIDGQTEINCKFVYTLTRNSRRRLFFISSGNDHLARLHRSEMLSSFIANAGVGSHDHHGLA